MTEVSSSWEFICLSCQSRLAFGPETFGCPHCRERGRIGLLELQLVKGDHPCPLRERAGCGLARYLDLLPIPEPSCFLSLGEGGTALIPSRRIGPELGLDLHFKLEQQNPTLSFKDRFVSLSINAAVGFGFRSVAVSSTGNLGLSVAAYSAAAGLRCAIIAPRGTPTGILNEAQLYGAEVIIIDPALRLAALEELRHLSGWFPIGLFLPRAVQNPFGIEGYKSFAYEIVEALGDAPAAMVFPCARGNGLYGAWKGFLEARRWGWSTSLPRMVACQPLGADSLRVSVETGAPRAVELAPAASIARSTSEAVAGDAALDAIRQSGGTALAASDDAIREAIDALGREGLNVEASSALPVACLREIASLSTFDRHRPIVCVLTATGLRWPELRRRHSKPAREIASVDALVRLLR